jgi:hypothetical protein
MERIDHSKISSGYFKTIKNVLSRESSLLNTWKNRLVFSFALFLISYGFLVFFKPFGLNNFPPEVGHVLILKYSSYPLFVWFSILALSSFLFKTPYTVLRSLVMLLILTIIAGLTSYIIWINHFGYMGFNWYTFKDLQMMAFSTIFMPMLIIIVIHSNYNLQKRLKEVENLNQAIGESEVDQKQKVVFNISSKEQKRSYQFKSEEVIYIQSQDNYVNILTDEQGMVKQNLVRTTLSQTESEISPSCSHIFRCHNSFIVNMDRVVRIEGNSSGYKLYLKDRNNIIPVSRKYVPIVQSYFNK